MVTLNDFDYFSFNPPNQNFINKYFMLKHHYQIFKTYSYVKYNFFLPSNGQLQVCIEIGLVVILSDPEGSGQPEVWYFDEIFRKDENVSGRQVPMDEPHRFEVFHSFADLLTEIWQTNDVQRRTKWRLFQTLQQWPENDFEIKN